MRASLRTRVWRGRRAAAVALGVVAWLACQPESTAPRYVSTQYVATGCGSPGGQKFADEPELFGAIFDNGVRSGCGHVVELVPDGITATRLHSSFIGELGTNPAFELQFGWWDPSEIGGMCGAGSVDAYENGGSTQPEHHWTQPWSGHEAHCVRPGTYTFSLDGSLTMKVEYLQTEGFVLNGAGQPQYIEIPTYSSAIGAHDLVINVDLPLDRGGIGTDSPALLIQKVPTGTDPTSTSYAFSGSSNVSGTAADWFRYSMLGSTWPNTYNRGSVLAKLYWDRDANPDDATGFYDADAYGDPIIRLHRYPNPTTATRAYHVALELRRPAESPLASPPPSIATVTINRLYPDLSATSVVAPNNATAGGTYTVTFVVANLGVQAYADAEAGWSGQAYLSTDAILDGADVLVGGFGESQIIAAGTIVHRQVNVTIPGGQGAGTYYVLIKVDNSNAVLESNEINNATASGTVTVAAAQADLHPGTITIPSVAVRNSSSSFTINEQNLGSLAAPSGWDGRLWLSADQSLTTTPNFLLDTYAESTLIAAGGTHVHQRVVTVPGTVPNGSYYVVAQLDVNSEVSESNEANNEGASATTVQVTDLPAPSNFHITGCTQSGGGAKVFVTYTVAWNNNGAPAGVSYEIGENTTNNSGGASVTWTGQASTTAWTLGPYLKSPTAGPRYAWIRHVSGGIQTAWVALADNPMQPKVGCLL
jgi:hypothetical protein